MFICSLSINLSSVPFSAGKPGCYSYQKRCEYALKSGIMKNSVNVPPQPLPIEDEVLTIATRLSDVFLSNSTYPPKYFENIVSACRGETVYSFNFFGFTFPKIKNNYIPRVS